MRESIYIRPCVGCGYCCRESQCMIGIVCYGLKDVCPALYYDQHKAKYRCKLVEVSTQAREQLYIGAGCCSPLNSDRRAFVDIQALQTKGKKQWDGLTHKNRKT